MCYLENFAICVTLSPNSFFYNEATPYLCRVFKLKTQKTEFY